MKRIIATLSVLALSLVPLAALAATKATVAMQTGRGPVELRPVHHASFVMRWNNTTIVVDPTGDAEQYAGMGTPDLILITHAHSDHLSPETLAALDTQKAIMVMPQSVADKIESRYGEKRLVMANGDTARSHDVGIRAVPMYNLPASADAYHPKGWGNGYVLTLGDKRVYISGDTEGTPEMRGLENIDLAFVCMNLPYTMDVNQAADAVTDFAPKVVYPYHYRGQNVHEFKRLVDSENPDIEVRLRNWYKE